MLSPRISLARKIRQWRLKRQLSQREVARQVGCVQSYIAHIECGRRPCSRLVGEKLEGVLKARRGLFTSFPFPRGRPRLLDSARQALHQIRQAVALSPEAELPALSRPPSYPRPDRVAPRENPFWPMALHLGASAAEEVSRLEKVHRKDDRFWRLVNSLRFDSWSEKRLTVRVGLGCEQLVSVSLAALGCELRGVDGVSGKDTHRQNHPTFVLVHQGAAIAWMPQRCVRSQSGYRWPDAILVVSRGGHRITVVVEVDGPRYHQDIRRGEARDRDLGVDVLHVHPQVLGQDNGLDRILDWACSKLSGPGNRQQGV